MNYKNIYNKLIYKAQQRNFNDVTENHHIIPRCLGGSDEISNLVNLTPEEHYLAHQLLVKIYPNEPKLVFAANMMTVGRPNNKVYGWLKRKYYENLSNQFSENNSQYGTMWITNGSENKKIKKVDTIPEGWYKGRKVKQNKQITKKCLFCKTEYITNRNQSKYCSISCSSKNITRKPHSEKTRIKMSDRAKQRVNNSLDTKWITNDIIQKRIKSNDKLPSGWRYGRLMPS